MPGEQIKAVEPRRDAIIAKLVNVIDAEYSASTCYQYLAELIKNGAIKKQFMLSSETARSNQDILLDYLKELGVNDFVLEETCTFCKINPESFSLAGAIDLNLQINAFAVRYYKELTGIAPEQGRRNWFKKKLKEKVRQRDILKRERKFDHKDGELNLINSFCMSYIASKLSE